MVSPAPPAAIGGFAPLLVGTGTAFDCGMGSPILLVTTGMFGSLLG